MTIQCALLLAEVSDKVDAPILPAVVVAAVALGVSHCSPRSGLCLGALLLPFVVMIIKEPIEPWLAAALAREQGEACVAAANRTTRTLAVLPLLAVIGGIATRRLAHSGPTEYYQKNVIALKIKNQKGITLWSVVMDYLMVLSPPRSLERGSRSAQAAVADQSGEPLAP